MTTTTSTGVSENSNLAQNSSLTPIPDEYSNFGSFSRSRKSQSKVPPKQMQSSFGRCCFPVILALFLFVLISLIIAFIFSLRFIFWPRSTYSTDHLNFTSLQNISTYHSNHSKNVTHDDSANKYSIKVSLYDPSKLNDSVLHVDHSKLPLTNLTKMCMISKGQCWYHPKKYPHSCQKAFCESVEFKIEWNYSMNSVHFQPVSDVHEITPVPDRTPCSSNSWCINGQCQQTNDTRVDNWSKIQPVNGGWENNCENPKCLTNGFSLKYWSLLVMASKCPGMPCSAYTTEIRRLQFKSCTNPLPSHDGVGCDIKESPLLYGPVCQDCPTLLAGNDQRKLWPNDVLHALCGSSGRFLDDQRCSCVRPSGQVERVDEGAPCRAKLNDTHTEPGHCFFGKCLTYVGHKSLCINY